MGQAKVKRLTSLSRDKGLNPPSAMGTVTTGIDTSAISSQDISEPSYPCTLSWIHSSKAGTLRVTVLFSGLYYTDGEIQINLLPNYSLVGLFTGNSIN